MPSHLKMVDESKNVQRVIDWAVVQFFQWCVKWLRAIIWCNKLEGTWSIVGVFTIADFLPTFLEVTLFVNNIWGFELTGSVQTLRWLSRQMGSDYFCIYEVLDTVSDCSVDDYRFRSLYCKNEEDYQVVWQIGYELISLFNGVYSLFDSNFEKVEIRELWKNGMHQRYCENLDCFGPLGKPDISEENIATEFQKVKSDFRLFLLNKSTEDEGLYLILKYFNLEKNWVTYYRILESLESLAKEENINLSIDSDKRKRFANTANNYSLSGIHSRHGLKKNPKKNGTPAMMLNEAHDFIRNVAKHYVEAKYRS